jgi:hypothetical protein
MSETPLPEGADSTRARVPAKQMKIKKSKKAFISFLLFSFIVTNLDFSKRYA